MEGSYIDDNLDNDVFSITCEYSMCLDVCHVGISATLIGHVFNLNVTAATADVGHIQGTVTMRPAHAASYHVLCVGSLAQRVWCGRADSADLLQRVQIGSSVWPYFTLHVLAFFIPTVPAAGHLFYAFDI
jgi:hypothetical protein